ncbi:MAG TPA: HAMP domain-containing sensor histidine kinase [Actinomycetota bacterium]|nr:HAMP domain-containing sensor histidine kinase [Actinomycetota bacterium]
MSDESFGLEEGVALALRGVRQPRTGVAAVLSVTARAMGAELVAAYVLGGSAGRLAEMIASAGALTPELGPPGPADEQTSAVLQGCLQDAVSEDSFFPEPWSRLPRRVHVVDRLPLGGALVVLAAGGRGLDREVLRRVIGPLDLLVATMTVMERQESLEQELLRLRQDQALLSAGLQHDLRTPLTSILGAAQTLRDRPAGLTPEQRAELLEVIAAQAHRLNGMIGETLARHAAGPDVPVRAAHVDPLLVARRVCRAARSARGGEVAIDVEPAPFLCDESRLERALLNLVDNALKYAPDGTEVQVVGARTGDTYTFTVADAGPGVAPEVAAAMFSPYVTDPTRDDGTGLGLHSVAHLTEELGGKVSYARASGWTRFSLALPWREADET